MRRNKSTPKPCIEGVRDYCTDDCPYRRVLSVFGKSYTLGILRILARDGVARFNRIAQEVGGSTRTITDRLNELVRFGVIRRQAYPEIPPRVEYSLTEMGSDLKPVLDYIRSWGVKWVRLSSQKGDSRRA